MVHLKKLYYLDPQPFKQTDFDYHCHFCNQSEICYYNERYHVMIQQHTINYAIMR